MMAKGTRTNPSLQCHGATTGSLNRHYHHDNCYRWQSEDFHSCAKPHTKRILQGTSLARRSMLFAWMEENIESQKAWSRRTYNGRVWVVGINAPRCGF